MGHGLYSARRLNADHEDSYLLCCSCSWPAHGHGWRALANHAPWPTWMFLSTKYVLWYNHYVMCWLNIDSFPVHSADDETTSRSPVLVWEPEDKNLWLFNITGDPHETSDLSEEYPDVVKKMLESLTGYHATAVRPVVPCPDDRSNPARQNNTWGPWLRDGEEESLVALCGNLPEIYEEFRYRSPGQKDGPGIILLVVIVLVCCLILFGIIFAIRQYCAQKRWEIRKERLMDHEWYIDTMV